MLRDYQVRAIDDLRAGIRQGHRSQVLVSPTGSGKSTIAAAMIQSAVSRAKRCLFLAHRTELIDQCSARLASMGVEHGIIQATRQRKPAPVQVASVPTLARREYAPDADLIFVDECHRARAASYLQVLERYPGIPVVGLTATPVRSDGRGLGELFSRMVHCPSVAELTVLGYLVPCRVFAPPGRPDMSGVKIKRGDYDEHEMAGRCDKKEIIGDVVREWARLAGGRQTVAFAVNLAHSKHIVEQFRGAGVVAEHLDGDTPDRERLGILERLAGGQTRLVSNCGVLTEGWDCPIVSAVILARPTAAMGLYLQMAGRCLRPAPGKSDALILDHAGAAIDHGLVDEDREWDLGDGIVRSKCNENAPSIHICGRCFIAYPSALRVCPECRLELEAPAVPDHTPGELIEVQRKASIERWKSRLDQDGRQKYYRDFYIEGKRKGFKSGYAAAKYKSIFGDWPAAGWKRECDHEFPADGNPEALAGLEAVPQQCGDGGTPA